MRELGIEPTHSRIELFSGFMYELKKWNRTHNLTALKKDEDIIVKHFIDSLVYLQVIPQHDLSHSRKLIKLCDIGSGAGFPGIPIAIVRPDLDITLVESSKKKAAFLRHIKRSLPLGNISVLESRVEDVGVGLFDIALTRALFNTHDLMKKAAHVIKKDGFIVLSKGPKFSEEMKVFAGNMKVEVVKVELSSVSLQRNIIKIAYG